MKCIMCGANMKPKIAPDGIKYCPKCNCIVGSKGTFYDRPKQIGWRCTACQTIHTLATKIDNHPRSCTFCGEYESLIPLYEVSPSKKPSPPPAPPSPGIKAFDVQMRFINKDTATDRPKDVKGKYKPHLVLGSLTRAIARVREYGVAKYHGENGWKLQTPEDYMDAIGRHYDSCRNDPRARDQESGLLHIAQIATSAMFIIDMLKEQGIDLDTMKEPKE